MKQVVGIVFADEMEYNPFAEYAKKQTEYQEFVLHKNVGVRFLLNKGERTLEVIGVQCGIGKVNAAHAVTALILESRAEIILNAGLSGAIASVRREDFVVGTTYIECDFDLRPLGYKLGEKPNQTYLYKADKTLLSLALQSKGLSAKPLGTGDFFLADKAKKEEVYDVFGVYAFDMETAAIAAVCHKMDVPVLCIRKISDDGGGGAMDDYREMNEREEESLTEVLSHLVERMLQEDSLWNKE